MRIAICDDSAQDAQFVKNMVIHWAKSRKTELQAEIFSSAESFLFHYAEDKNFDILLLDIEMGNMDGVALAKRIRKDKDAVQIVFITGFADYISQGYEVSALHYLIKPVQEEKLFGVLERAAEALQKAPRFLLVPAEGEMRRVPVSGIVYAEAFAHSVELHTVRETIPAKISISELEKQLGDDFVRCHRSYLVGLKYISRLSRTEVTLDSGKTLPLSRSAAPLVHNAFISYYTEAQNEPV